MKRGLRGAVLGCLMLTGWSASALEPAFKISGAFANPAGKVQMFKISPDSSHVVYRADAAAAGVNELYSVALSGGEAVRLNAALPSGGDVDQFLITPDSTRVLYRADQAANNVFDLFVVPIGGGTPVRLNGVLETGRDVYAYDAASYKPDFQVSPDSSRAVFFADTVTDDVQDLFSVPLTGGAPVKINGPRTGLIVRYGFLVTISADSTRVVYSTEQAGDNGRCVYSVPLAGGTPVRLSIDHDPDTYASHLAYRDAGGVTPDSSRVIYSAKLSASSKAELYSVPIAGGASSKINLPLPPGSGEGVGGFGISPGGEKVIYQADVGINESFIIHAVSPAGGDAIRVVTGLDYGEATSPQSVFQDAASLPAGRVVFSTSSWTVPGLLRLRSVALSGSGLVTLSTEGYVPYPFGSEGGISPDGSRVLFNTRATSTPPARQRLFSVPMEGGTAVMLHPPLAADRGVAEETPAISSDSRFAAYRADAETAAVFEAYVVPLAGGDAAKVSSAGATGGTTAALAFTPDATTLVFSADQEVKGKRELFATVVRRRAEVLDWRSYQ